MDHSDVGHRDVGHGDVEHRAQHRLGILLVAGSAVAYSTAGFFTKFITVDSWTMLFWRAVFSSLFIAGYLAIRQGAGVFRAFRAMRGADWVVAVCSALGMILIINAYRLTAVTNVAVIYALAPFLSAALAWAWIGERVTANTLAASATALFGVIILVNGTSVGGHLVGDLLAFAMTAMMAVIMVVARQRRALPMVPAMCLSTVLCAIVSLPFASPLSVSAVDLGYLAIFGVTQLSMGLLLLITGARYIPAAQTALVGALDVPLTPVWVWLAFGEVPDRAAVVGGTVVLAAVVGHLVVDLRPRRRAEAA